MFHKKINKRIGDLEIMHDSILEATSEVFGVIGSDVNKVKSRVHAMETYFGIEYNPSNGSYAKAKKLKVKKTK